MKSSFEVENTQMMMSLMSYDPEIVLSVLKELKQVSYAAAGVDGSPIVTRFTEADIMYFFIHVTTEINGLLGYWAVENDLCTRALDMVKRRSLQAKLEDDTLVDVVML